MNGINIRKTLALNCMAKINKNVIIGVLFMAAVIVITAESWFIYAIYNVEKRIIPLNYFIFNNGDGWVSVGYDDTYVSAEGTWISDAKLANPIQSSKIICFQDSMLCIEARGEVSDSGHLIVDTNLFDIETWNDREIVTKPDDSAFSCTRYIMRFDRTQKQVSATRTTIKNTDECAVVDNQPIHLYLGNGLDAWNKINRME